MSRWRLERKIWCNWPAKPIGLIEIIGGSYFSASPQISYKYLLENLEKKGFAIHAWKYLPSFDHQSQANEAWKEFRYCKKKLEVRINKPLRTIRLGHSLGCKLHLLSPDNGRSTSALIALSFNNFNANKSIPMLKKLASRLNIEAEFSPSPPETMKLILQKYLQPNNLVISFTNDRIDQSSSLIKCLNLRGNDITTNIVLKGNHLTPVSTGLSKNIVADLEITKTKSQNLKDLLETIVSYSLDKLGS